MGSYLDIAKDMGLYAIVRPGPLFVQNGISEDCLGGFLSTVILNFVVITTDSKKVCAPYLKKVCDIIKPRIASSNDNIIFVQIKNEYGGYGNDKEYLGWLKSFCKTNGIDCGLLTSEAKQSLFL